LYEIRAWGGKFLLTGVCGRYHPGMFSYRHAFHAGNHADVLKHTTLIATLRHLMRKEPSITLVDTHAGAGLYRLDGDYAEKGGEAVDGIVKLMAALRPARRSTGARARRWTTISI
jgi:23S rRNA (adenine2030-N6)-methyltransferase